MEAKPKINREMVLDIIGKLGWSQNRMADELGITRQYTSHVMMGRGSPGLGVLKKFADALGVKNPCDLVDWGEEDNPKTLAEVFEEEEHEEGEEVDAFWEEVD